MAKIINFENYHKPQNDYVWHKTAAFISDVKLPGKYQNILHPGKVNYTPQREVIQMENKRVGITLGKTINVGNYESVRVDITLSGDIDDRMDFGDVVEELSGEGHILLEREAKIAVSKHHN